MNHSKAREYFSAYYEETLEPGLRHSLEQRLSSDAQLQAEYRAFSDTMEQLATLSLEEIEVPIYLSDRIATRLESASTPTARGAWFGGWLPRLALGGLFAAALFGAGLSIFKSGGASYEATVLPGSDISPKNAQLNQLIIRPNGHDVDVSLTADTAKTVRFTSDQGTLLKSVDLTSGSTVHAPIRNTSASPSLTKISVTDDALSTWIALPGVEKQAKKPGSGTVKEFAVALAGAYGQPVLVRATNSETMLSWRVDGKDAKSSAISALDSTTYSVTISGSNMLTISDR